MFAKKERQEVEIPTASLADIAFLLLVFFLVTTHFDSEKGLNLRLPPPSDNTDMVKSVKKSKEDFAKVMVGPEGDIFLTYMGNEENVLLKDLKRTLKKYLNDFRKKKDKELIIQLITDSRAKYENMVAVLDEIQLSGAKIISLKTR
jgi:biopolymer transport protein ExbD